MIGTIPTQVKKINNIISDLTVNDDKIIDLEKIPKINVKERLEKYFCAINEFGDVEYYAKIPTAKKDKIGGNWMATFQESLMWLAEKRLNGETLSVFLAMCSVMDFENYIRINQSELAKKIHTDQGNISRSIKKLLELNIITEGPRAGLNKTYMLNPNIGIKGKHRQQKIIDYEEAKLTRKMEKKRTDYDADD